MTGAPTFALIGLLTIAAASAHTAAAPPIRSSSAPAVAASAVAAVAPAVVVDLQPFAAQVARLVEALAYIGVPLADVDKQAIETALKDPDEARASAAVQQILDRRVLLHVHINPESRVQVLAGAAKPELVQQGWRTFLVKVTNEAGITATLRASSPQAQRVFSRGKEGFSMSPKPEQTISPRDVADRWLDLSPFDKPPLTPTLSGLAVEYRILQLYSRDAGKRDATFSFNVGQGTQDIGFRSDLPVLFTCLRSSDVVLRVLDENNQPATASFLIRDAQGHVYPSQAKRLAPDFAFQPQIYRKDGERVTLAPGEYTVDYTRGPEYVTQRKTIKVPENVPPFTLQRWIDLARLGWYSGDHHVHAAGCLHYESPTEGVLPQDMIRHILGEGLNVAAILTWGPGYYYQKRFFEGRDNSLSSPDHLMRYDVEVSGFPSSHAGHLVLLRLKNQDYPGARVLEDWPTWNLPILQWAKAQGAVVGYAHSGWGLEIKDTTFPTREMPKFDGVGANEFIVDVTHDAVDFISTIDTPAPWELNIWYHTLNAGFRTRIAGETDFPCIYGDRVGLGRSYVKLEQALTYAGWAEGIRDGRAYVTDGRSHLIDFAVNGRAVGTSPTSPARSDKENSELQLSAAATVHVTARVAARLEPEPVPAVRGTPASEKPYWDLERARIGDTREVPVELIVNGRVAATQKTAADGTLRDIAFDVAIDRSSWIALRILPSSHTNPIFAIVGGQPIRASRESAEWCLAAVDQCWSQKSPKIAAKEQEAAARAYDHARAVYRQRIAESPQD
jgi:hypothetical protein